MQGLGFRAPLVGYSWGICQLGSRVEGPCEGSGGV